jgi:hypothetical protein
VARVVARPGIDGCGRGFGFDGAEASPTGGVGVSLELAALATPEVERSVTVASRIATGRVSDIRGAKL